MTVREAITFDDVLLEPSESAVLPSETILKTKITKNIDLNIPLASAAMDTVTESNMAIAMAQAGGIGVIHRNLEIEQQIKEVNSWISKNLDLGTFESILCTCSLDI